MKTRSFLSAIAIAVLIVACAGDTFAQSTWIRQNPLPTGNTLHAVSCAGSATTIAVGDRGTILRTSDGGITWARKESGTAANLHDVFFAGPQTGFAVGNAGVILRTTDGGVHWTILQSGTTVNLLGVYFTGPDHGIAVGGDWGDGGLVLRTTDGGTTWIPGSSGTKCPLEDVAFADSRNGIAVGNAGIYRGVVRTTDGGLSWVVLTAGPGRGSGVSFADARNGTIVGCRGTYPTGEIWHTSDGGATWESQPSGTGATLSGVHFSDSSHGVAVGGDRILRTTDGGASWSVQAPGYSLESVSFSDSSTGTGVGYNGTIVRTTDGGTTWASQAKATSTAEFTLTGVCLPSGRVGMAVGSRTWTLRNYKLPYCSLLRTDDGGESWRGQTSEAMTRNRLRAVDLVDGSTGIVVGEHLDSATGIGGGLVLKTTDGGGSWFSVAPNISLTEYCGVSFFDSDTGTVVGGRYDHPDYPHAIILRTTNGGADWVKQLDAVAFPLRGVSFTGPQYGTAVGDQGTILRTTDGGETWVSKVSGTIADLEAVSFASVSVGVVVGSQDSLGYPRGTICRTTDGGESWQVRLSEPRWRLHGVCFSDENTGTIVGEFDDDGGISACALILHTTDGGATWSTWMSGETLPLHAVAFADAQHGTAVGLGGTILHTTTGGATWVEEPSSDAIATPQSISLLQNYPNPFNPTTVIRCQLPVAGMVRLVVYDLLGREVKVLVDEKRGAGIQEVTFDGSGLSSGLYICRLMAGDYVTSKTMMLLK